MTKREALKLAISSAGSQTKLAELLGIGQSNVSMWLSRGRVSYDRVLDVERVTGVSRHDLRPDIYPREDAA